MKKLVLSVALFGSLAACQSHVEITQDPRNAALTNVSAKDRLSDGTSTVVVRAFREGVEGKRGEEIIGAKCNLLSDDLVAEAVTPQEVVVPKFKQRAEFADRGVPSALVVSCNYGELKGVTQVTAAAKSTSVMTGAGIAGAVLSIATTAALAASTPWVYQDIAYVVLTDG